MPGPTTRRPGRLPRRDPRTRTDAPSRPERPGGGHRAAARGVAAAALLALCAAAPLHGQEPRSAGPGEVVTLPVAVPAPAGETASRARYRVDRLRGARLFGAREGAVEVEDGEALVPLTFQVGEDRTAGTAELARLRVLWPGGAEDTVPVSVGIPVRRRIEGGFTEASAMVSPGGTAELRYAVVNRGNAGDTVRLATVQPARGWRVAPRRSRVTLAAGGSDTVAVRVDAPGRASLGSMQRLRLAAAGLGGKHVDEVTLQVVESGGWVPGVEHVPGQVFVGSTTGAAPGASGGMVAAIEAGGSVGARTRVFLQGQYRPERLLTPRPLRQDVLGPELRLRVRSPDWQAGVGDVFARTDPLAGSFLSGRGADVSWEAGGSYGEVFVAMPQSRTSPDRGGHAVLAAGGLELDDGRVGLVASDVRRSSGLGLASGRTQSVGGRLHKGDRSSRFVSVEAGLLRLTRDGGPGATGPAAEGELWLSGQEGTLDVRGRLVPGELTGGPTLSDQLFAGGSYRVDGPIAAVGRAGWSSAERTPEGPSSEFRQAEAGVRYAPRGLRLEGVLRVRESEGIFGAGGRTRYTGVASVDAPAGPLQVSGRAEVGREEEAGLDGSAFHRLRASIHWSGEPGWGRLGLGHARSVGFGSRAFVEGEGGVDLDAATLSGGASAESGALGDVRVEGWTRVAYRISGGLSVVAGVERNDFGFGGGEWGVSMGVRKGLDLPLPFPDRPVSHGVVFLDADGDGRRDPGERGLPGVTVGKGFVDATTDAQGRFRIHQEAVRGEPLEVDATSLPPGALVPPGVEIPRHGEVAIPVLRTASLQISAFVDDDGNGERDSGEAPLADAVVLVTDDEGRRRVEETDASGRARFAALRPGPYTVRIRVPGNHRRLATERELELELDPGAATTHTVAVPSETRTVRH